MKPKLNSAGRKDIEKLDQGLQHLKILCANGDIRGQVGNLVQIGAAGLIDLGTTTRDYCLKRVFSQLALDDVAVASRISELSSCDAEESAKIVCDLLDYKAGKIQECLRCNWN